MTFKEFKYVNQSRKATISVNNVT